MIGSRKYTKQIISSDRSTTRLVENTNSALQTSTETINMAQCLEKEMDALNTKIQDNTNKDNSVLRIMTDMHNQISAIKQDINNIKAKIGM
tara:strand:- start:3949 stop:4221 length:273 start_codon:yes stop_codon:yes gene_type:complete